MSGKQCLRVQFGRGGRPLPTQLECDGTGETGLGDFEIDSDKAIELAKKAGLSAPSFTLALSTSALPGVKGPLWTVMEGNGTKTGSKTAEFDAKTGALKSKSTMP